jgi:hypothetical protein
MVWSIFGFSRVNDIEFRERWNALKKLRVSYVIQDKDDRKFYETSLSTNDHHESEYVHFILES